MNTKAERLDQIRSLVSKRRITTQAEFIRLLEEKEHAVDQATLSRDLAELGIAKIKGRYVLTDPVEPVRQGALNVAAAVQSIETCGPNMAVIKTGIGEAQAVAVAIDELEESSIIATIGGDDTVVVLTKSHRTQAVALRTLEALFGRQ